MMFLVAVAVIIRRWWSQRRVPIDIHRAYCVTCGHVEDHPDALVAVWRLDDHTFAEHGPARERLT
jgi:hypothetical protein